MSLQYTSIMRKGVPPSHRKQVRCLSSSCLLFIDIVIIIIIIIICLKLWEALTGSAVFLEKQPHFFPDALKRVFTQSSVESRQKRARSLSGEKTSPAEQQTGDIQRSPQQQQRRQTAEAVTVDIPATVKRIPVFGGLFSPHDHQLSEAGVEASKRILVATALENPLLNYAPVLPDLGNYRLPTTTYHHSKICCCLT